MKPTAEEQIQEGLTRVWLLRHGETAAPGVFHGAESDIGLSERGRRQAEEVAERLARLRPHAIVSSAMRRAIDTAGPIAQACGLALRIEADLHERRVGELSGKPFDWNGGIWGQTERRWSAGETDFAPHGAESFDDIRRRVLPVWRRLTAEHAGRSLVIVAHGVICKVLLLSIGTGWGPADWARVGSIRNAAVHELLGREDRWQIMRFNDEVLRSEACHG